VGNRPYRVDCHPVELLWPTASRFRYPGSSSTEGACSGIAAIVAVPELGPNVARIQEIRTTAKYTLMLCHCIAYFAIATARCVSRCRKVLAEEPAVSASGAKLMVVRAGFFDTADFRIFEGVIGKDLAVDRLRSSFRAAPSVELSAFALTREKSPKLGWPTALSALHPRVLTDRMNFWRFHDG